MGVHVNLSVLSESIGRDRWKQVFDETLRLLAGWPDPPLGIAWRLVEGVRIVAYPSSYQNEQGWTIVGDQRSRLRCETFEFPKELPRCDRGGSAARARSDDILAALAREVEDESANGLARVFGAKTQERPYHDLLVAVATLVENRFPKHAIAHGDLTARHSDRACQVLEQIFGETFAPPVLLDEQRVRSRVPKKVADELVATYSPSPADDGFAADILGILMRKPMAKVRHELEWIAPSCTNPRTLDEHTRDYFDAIVKRVVELSVPWRETRAALSNTERADLLREIAAGTHTHGVRLTEIAWNEIERSDDVSLAFLHVLAWLDSFELHLHLAVTAMFESRALRERATRLWARWRPLRARDRVSEHRRHG